MSESQVFNPPAEPVVGSAAVSSVGGEARSPRRAVALAWRATARVSPASAAVPSSRKDAAAGCRGAHRIPLGPIEDLVAGALGVAAADLRTPGRGRAPVAFARQTAMYLAHTGLGLNYSEVGRLFRRDRTTAAHACQVVEERRDDPRIEATLTQLERACASLIGDGAGEGRP